MDENAGDEPPNLTLLEGVRCLECGAFYSKPSGGGTVEQNPGCPECGYVGWIAMGSAFKEDAQPRHLVEGHLQRPTG